MRLEDKIRSIPDYPKKGIIFRDITTLLGDKDAFKTCIDQMAELCDGMDIDYIAGIDARGFIIGSAMAYKLGCAFIPVRKPGKLPYDKISMSYDLEYGKDSVEIHKDAAPAGSKVLVVDDLLATGGTAKAAIDLLKQINLEVLGAFFTVELIDLKGRDHLKGVKVKSLVKYEGE
ncbi:adenine phosphoribosyltransferase [Peptoniphilus sp. GNH]|nr:adenine phosphoribosyltransferase [Clostridiales bacterium KA00134]UHR02824.1 adenine phosphoribosyltransferase [Peptoniphilus sp. GNH]